MHPVTTVPMETTAQLRCRKVFGNSVTSLILQQLEFLIFQYYSESALFLVTVVTTTSSILFYSILFYSILFYSILIATITLFYINTLAYT